MSEEDDAAAAFYDNPENLRTRGPVHKRAGHPRLPAHTPVRFDQDTIAAIRQFSDEDGVTVSAWVRRVVDREIQRRSNQEGSTMSEQDSTSGNAPGQPSAPPQPAEPSQPPPSQPAPPQPGTPPPAQPQAPPAQDNTASGTAPGQEPPAEQPATAAADGAPVGDQGPAAPQLHPELHQQGIGETDQP